MLNNLLLWQTVIDANLVQDVNDSINVNAHWSDSYKTVHVNDQIIEEVNIKNNNKKQREDYNLDILYALAIVAFFAMYEDITRQWGEVVVQKTFEYTEFLCEKGAELILSDWAERIHLGQITEVPITSSTFVFVAISIFVAIETFAYLILPSNIVITCIVFPFMGTVAWKLCYARGFGAYYLETLWSFVKNLGKMVKAPFEVIISKYNSWRTLSREERVWENLHTPKNFSPRELESIHNAYTDRALNYFQPRNHYFWKTVDAISKKHPSVNYTRSWTQFFSELWDSLGHPKETVHVLSSIFGERPDPVDVFIIVVCSVMVFAGVVSFMIVRDVRNQGFDHGFIFSEFDWMHFKWAFTNKRRWQLWLQGKVEVDGTPSEIDERGLCSIRSMSEALSVINSKGEKIYNPLNHSYNTAADHGILYIKNLMKTNPDEVTVADLKHLEDYANYIEKIWALQNNSYYSSTRRCLDSPWIDVWGDMCFRYFYVYPYEFACDVVNIARGKDTIIVNRIPESWDWFLENLYLFY